MYLLAHDLIPSSQFAYRKHHSTEDALTLAVDRWIRAKSDYLTTGVILVDMSKAFDRVQHERMLSVLFSMGIGGTVLKWFGSYLSGRKQRVKVGPSLAPEFCCTRGVPQGSVLGPLLFLLYTSELSSVLPAQLSHQEFADDIMLDYSHKDPTVIAATLSDGVTCLAKWLDDIGLLLNEKKTQIMFIPPHGTTCAQYPAVYCKGFPLSVVSTVKYLGLMVDSDLSFSSHLDHLASKSRKATFQLWRYAHSLTTKAKRIWYVSMVQSSLCYSSNAFFPALSATSMMRLVRMSKAAVRAVCAVHLPASTSPLLTRLDLRPLLHILLAKILVFAFRCIRGLCSPLLCQLFTLASSSSTSLETRGRTSNLMCVPFVRGPSSRSLLRFQASVFWNSLPFTVRQLSNQASFINAIHDHICHTSPVISSPATFFATMA